MDWRWLPVAPFANVRAYCSHVKMYCKRVRLLSFHPRLFIHSRRILNCSMRSCPKRAYTSVFCAVLSSLSNGRGSRRHPSWCSGSRSPGCDTSFKLPFIACVAFRMDFMAGIILQFILIACVTFELFHSVRRFQLFFLFFLSLAISGVCHFRSSFMVFLVFCSPFSIIHSVCHLQVVFEACVAFTLFSRRVSPSGCFDDVCRLSVSLFWRV